MAHKYTPFELVQNTAYTIETRAYRVKEAETAQDVKKQMRLLRNAVDELERRKLAALDALSADPR